MIQKLNKKVLIFDDIIETELQDRILDNLVSGKALSNCWSYAGNTVGFNTYNPNEEKIYDTFQFVKVIIDNKLIIDINSWGSGLYKIIENVSKKINYEITPNKINRAKLNLQTRISKKHKSKYNLPHLDLDPEIPFYSLIYYLKDSDGDTVIFENYNRSKIKKIDKTFIENLKVLKEIKPKKGRVVIFDGRYLHTGRNPSNYDNRIVFNVCFR